jgi:hypothetical protein
MDTWVLKGPDDGICYSELLVFWTLSIVFNVNKTNFFNGTQLNRHHLKTEEDPFSETLWILEFYVFVF